jgi:hypothetical protein
MEKSIPSDYMLKEISPNKNYTGKYFSFQRNLEAGILERLMGDSAEKIINEIGNFYRLGLNPLTKFNYSPVIMVFMEGIKNAIAHGPKYKKFIAHSLFLGNKGIIQGFKDFGDYFKSEKTKKIWENKIHISSTNKSDFSGRGFGNGIIYENSELINVNTKEGILYCMQSHDLLEIVPGKFYQKY